MTRCTEVKPMMQVATYTCDQCGAETYQPVIRRKLHAQKIKLQLIYSINLDKFDILHASTDVPN